MPLQFVRVMRNSCWQIQISLINKNCKGNYYLMASYFLAKIFQITGFLGKLEKRVFSDEMLIIFEHMLAKDLSAP